MERTRPTPLREQVGLYRKLEPGEVCEGIQSLYVHHPDNAHKKPVIFYPPINDNISAVLDYLLHSVAVDTGTDFMEEFGRHMDRHQPITSAQDFEDGSIANPIGGTRSRGRNGQMFPQITNHALNLGAEYSPADMCDPYKALLGFYLTTAQAINAAGDAFREEYKEIYAGEMSGGYCRQALYVLLQDLALNDYYRDERGLNRKPDYDFLILRETKKGIIEFIGLLMKATGIENQTDKTKHKRGVDIERIKAQVVDAGSYLKMGLLINETVRRVSILEDLEDKARYAKCLMRGDNVDGFKAVNDLLIEARRIMTNHTKNKKEVREEIESIKTRLNEARDQYKDPNRDEPLATIAVVGEFLHIVNEGLSADYLRELTKRGIYCKQIIGIGHYAHRFKLGPMEIAKMMGLPTINTEHILAYLAGLKRDVAGHARDTVGTTEYVARMLGVVNQKRHKTEKGINKACKYINNQALWLTVSVVKKIRGENEKFDGILQVGPFNCLPEVVARNILRDHRMPRGELVFAGLEGHTGYHSRIDAFADTVIANRREREKKSKLRKRVTIFKAQN